jgi:YVTN family beta-propeller protein
MSFPWMLVSTAGLLLFALQSGGDQISSKAKGTLVVVNQSNHSVLLIAPEERRTFATITVGVNGHEAAVSPDGRMVYVPIYGNSGVGKPGTDGASIDVIDLELRKLSTPIQLGKPVRPHRAEFGPDGLLYVTAELANEVEIVDPATRKVVGQIPTGAPQSHMLVLSPDAKRAYTANVISGNVSVLDVPGRKLITVMPVAKTIQRISISPDGKQLFTHDQGTPRVAVIDIPSGAEADSAASYKVTRWIDVPDVAYASEVTPDGKWLLLACIKKRVLLAVDVQTMKVVKSLDMPGAPSEILIRPDGGVAFVSCMDTGKIAVVNLQTWTLEQPIELTAGVDGLAWVSATPGK